MLVKLNIYDHVLGLQSKQMQNQVNILNNALNRLWPL